MSEEERNYRFISDVVAAALKKADEHLEYSHRFYDPNDLQLPGLEQIRKEGQGVFSEEELEVYYETVRDYGFRLGAKRGAEEMLDQLLERLGVESLEYAERYIQRGREEGP
jgi:hypothetical protein